jgi:putative DNA methylase
VRATAWEAVHYLIHALDKEGELAAAQLLTSMGSLGDTACDLAYRLYSICEKKKWAQDAQAYNMLVSAWPRLKELALRQSPKQEKLI